MRKKVQSIKHVRSQNYENPKIPKNPKTPLIKQIMSQRQINPQEIYHDVDEINNFVNDENFLFKMAKKRKFSDKEKNERNEEQNIKKINEMIKMNFLKKDREIKKHKRKDTLEIEHIGEAGLEGIMDFNFEENLDFENFQDIGKKEILGNDLNFGKVKNEDFGYDFGVEGKKEIILDNFVGGKNNLGFEGNNLDFGQIDRLSFEEDFDNGCNVGEERDLKENFDKNGKNRDNLNFDNNESNKNNLIIDKLNYQFLNLENDKDINDIEILKKNNFENNSLDIENFGDMSGLTQEISDLDKSDNNLEIKKELKNFEKNITDVKLDENNLKIKNLEKENLNKNIDYKKDDNLKNKNNFGTEIENNISNFEKDNLNSKKIDNLNNNIKNENLKQKNKLEKIEKEENKIKNIEEEIQKKNILNKKNSFENFEDKNLKLEIEKKSKKEVEFESEIYKKKVTFNLDSGINSFKKNSVSSLKKNNFELEKFSDYINSQEKISLMKSIKKNLILNSKRNSMNKLPAFIDLNIEKEFAKINSKKDFLDFGTKEIEILSFRENLKIEKKIEKEENIKIRNKKIEEIRKAFKKDHKTNLTNYHLILDQKEKKIDEFSFYNKSVKNDKSEISEFCKSKMSNFEKENNKRNLSTKDLEIFLPLTESRQSEFFESVVSDNFDDIIEEIIEKEEKGISKEEINKKKEKINQKKKSIRFSKKIFPNDSFGPNKNFLQEKIEIMRNKNFKHLDNEFQDGTLEMPKMVLFETEDENISGIEKRKSSFKEEIGSVELEKLGKFIKIEKKVVYEEREVKKENLVEGREFFDIEKFDVELDRQIGKEFEEDFGGNLEDLDGEKDIKFGKNKDFGKKIGDCFEKGKLIKTDFIKNERKIDHNIIKRKKTLSSLEGEEISKKDKIILAKKNSESSFIIDLEKINKDEKIKLILNYKKSLILKMNKVFENNNFTNDSQISLFEIQKEMKNIINLKFLIFENNLKNGEIEKIIKIQRFFKKIICLTILRKIISQNKFFVNESTINGSFFYHPELIKK